MGIGRRIKEARENAGLTQEELGKLVGVTGSAITNYEKEVSHPKEPVMYALINALQVEPNWLFQDVVNIPPAPAKPKPRTDPAAAAALFESLPEGRREAAMEYMEALRLIEETQSGETALSEKSA